MTAHNLVGITENSTVLIQASVAQAETVHIGLLLTGRQVALSNSVTAIEYATDCIELNCDTTD